MLNNILPTPVSFWLTPCNARVSIEIHVIGCMSALRFQNF